MKTTVFLLLIAATPLLAHIDNTSLSIKGGESYVAGQNVVLTWKVAVFHQKPHYLYFSEAPDKPWKLIDTVSEKAGVANMSYTWTVPALTITTARIRIFQSAGGQPAEKSNDYTIISNTFTISQTTGINSKPVFTQTVPTGNKSTNNTVTTDLNGRKMSQSHIGKMSKVHFPRLIMFTKQ